MSCGTPFTFNTLIKGLIVNFIKRTIYKSIDTHFTHNNVNKDHS